MAAQSVWMQPGPGQTLCFGIAGVALQVTGPDSWLAPLRCAWAPWLLRETVDAWPVDLIPNPALAPPDAPLFESVPRCRDGLCTLVGAGFQGRVDAGQARARLQAHPRAAPADAGYFLRVVAAVQAFARGGMLFHAAGVVHQARGYAFFGLSGSGKTTVARFSAPAPVLNDDLLLVWPAGEGWSVYATPFGKRRGTPEGAPSGAPSGVPLCALLRLVKDRDVFLRPLPKSRALGDLVANTPVLSGDGVWLPSVLSRWDALMARVPVYALHFRQDPAFWEVIDAELG